MDEPGAVLDGTVLVPVDHPLHPLRLAGEIDVVDARLGHSGDELRAVEGVRPDGRDHEVRVGTHLGQRIGIVGIDRDPVDLGARPGSHLGELVRVAPSHRPRHVAVAAVSVHHVLREDLTDEAGRSEQDDVVGPGASYHVPTVPGRSAESPGRRTLACTGSYPPSAT